MLVTQEHVDWLNDKELMQYSEHRHRQHDLGTQFAYTGGHHPERHLWLIRCNGADIGTLSAYVDSTNKHANLGILIGSRAHQGQGLAAEAWTTVVDYLFDEGFHKVECGCMDTNHRMRRLATTTGFTLEATIPGHFRVGDRFEGLVLYGRFKVDKYHSEWERMWRPPFWKPGEQTSASS